MNFSGISFQLYFYNPRTIKRKLSILNLLSLGSVIIMIELPVIYTGVCKWFFQAIFITLLWLMSWSLSVSKLSVQNLLWNPVVTHARNMTTPTEPVFPNCCFSAVDRTSLKHVYITDINYLKDLTQALLMKALRQIQVVTITQTTFHMHTIKRLRHKHSKLWT